MSIANKAQLQEIVEYMGQNITAPQVVSHYDKANVYSTEEQRVGVWINGKPIYKKTLQTTFPSNGASKYVDIGAPIEWGSYEAQVITPTGIQVLNALKLSGTTVTWLLRAAIIPNTDTTHPNAIFIENTAGTAYNDKTVYITVLYTKTTDSAVDYTIEDTNIYSDKETLIGKWFGEDLYQRTFIKTPITTNDEVIEIGVACGMVFAKDAFVTFSGSGNRKVIPCIAGNGTKVDLSIFDNRGTSPTKNVIRVQGVSDAGWATGTTLYVTIQYTKA